MADPNCLRALSPRTANRRPADFVAASPRTANRRPEDFVAASPRTANRRPEDFVAASLAVRSAKDRAARRAETLAASKSARPVAAPADRRRRTHGQPTTSDPHLKFESKSKEELKADVKRARKNEASIPELLSSAERAAARAEVDDDDAGLVDDPIKAWEDRKAANPWTAEEKTIFKDKLALYPWPEKPKNYTRVFSQIAEHLGRKSAAECVQHYYTNTRPALLESYRAVAAAEPRASPDFNDDAAAEPRASPDSNDDVAAELRALPDFKDDAVAELRASPDFNDDVAAEPRASPAEFHGFDDDDVAMHPVVEDAREADGADRGGGGVNEMDTRGGQDDSQSGVEVDDYASGSQSEDAAVRVGVAEQNRAAIRSTRRAIVVVRRCDSPPVPASPDEHSAAAQVSAAAGPQPPTARSVAAAQPQMRNAALNDHTYGQRELEAAGERPLPVSAQERCNRTELANSQLRHAAEGLRAQLNRAEAETAARETETGLRDELARAEAETAAQRQTQAGLHDELARAEAETAALRQTQAGLRDELARAEAETAAQRQTQAGLRDELRRAQEAEVEARSAARQLADTQHEREKAFGQQIADKDAQLAAKDAQLRTSEAESLQLRSETERLRFAASDEKRRRLAVKAAVDDKSVAASADVVVTTADVVVAVSVKPISRAPSAADDDEDFSRRSRSPIRKKPPPADAPTPPSSPPLFDDASSDEDAPPPQPPSVSFSGTKSGAGRRRLRPSELQEVMGRTRANRKK